jgi:hypothetical protein
MPAALPVKAGMSATDAFPVMPAADPVKDGMSAVLVPVAGGGEARTSICFCSHHIAPVDDVAPDELPDAPRVLIAASIVPFDHDAELLLVQPDGVVRFGDAETDMSIRTDAESSAVDVNAAVEWVSVPVLLFVLTAPTPLAPEYWKICADANPLFVHETVSASDPVATRYAIPTFQLTFASVPMRVHPALRFCVSILSQDHAQISKFPATTDAGSAGVMLVPLDCDARAPALT